MIGRILETDSWGKEEEGCVEGSDGDRGWEQGAGSARDWGTVIKEKGPGLGELEWGGVGAWAWLGLTGEHWAHQGSTGQTWKTPGKGKAGKGSREGRRHPSGYRQGFWGSPHPAPYRPLLGLCLQAAADQRGGGAEGRCSQAGRWEGPRLRRKKKRLEAEPGREKKGSAARRGGQGRWEKGKVR